MQPLQLSMTTASQSQIEETVAKQGIHQAGAPQNQSDIARLERFMTVFNAQNPITENTVSVETAPIVAEHNAIDADQSRKLRDTSEAEEHLTVSEIDAGSVEPEVANTDFRQHSDPNTPLTIGAEVARDLPVHIDTRGQGGPSQNNEPAASHHNRGEIEATPSSSLIRKEDTAQNTADVQRPASNGNRHIKRPAPTAVTELAFGTQMASHLSAAPHAELLVPQKASVSSSATEMQISESGQQINPQTKLSLTSIELGSSSVKPESAGHSSTQRGAHEIGKLDQGKPQDGTVRPALQNPEPSAMSAPLVAGGASHTIGTRSSNQNEVPRFSKGSSVVGSRKATSGLVAGQFPLAALPASERETNQRHAASQLRPNTQGSEEATMWSAALTKAKPQHQVLSAPPPPTSTPASINFTVDAFSLVAKDNSDVIKAISLEALPEASWDAPRVGSSSAGSLSTRPEIPQMLARQLAEGLQSGAGRPVDLTLNPEELGRVRLSLSPLENGMTVNILAERGETLELMRRHIEQLAQEFRGLGYENVTFSFGQGQEPKANSPEKNADQSDDVSAPDTDLGEIAQEAKPISLSTGSVSGLDLRL